MNRPKLKQPAVTARTRAEPPGFYGQELPDPEGRLTEEQKKWPVVTELLPPCAADGPSDTPPAEPPPPST